MKTTVSIKHLSRSEDRYDWSFTVIENSWTGHHESHYHTNNNGDGLFVTDYQGNSKQLVGTCDFTLHGCSKSAAYNRIKRFFEK